MLDDSRRFHGILLYFCLSKFTNIPYAVKKNTCTLPWGYVFMWINNIFVVIVHVGHDLFARLQAWKNFATLPAASLIQLEPRPHIRKHLGFEEVQ